ncbi:hypothetical protein CUJ83_14970 [Methanocella sp. CWC-04]|uniref:Uncharacterized protein n=1 Tax=Methanooceanicella nereidis TaxID=2052831 RepID=A0AAP2RFD5_9EURY|nr:hypothetical protein [Methanocella sp. CWC-04]MCD1296303.1 hypothetical protein [Methanocella sp. CWC-04]
MPEASISSESCDIAMRLKGDVTVEEYLSRVIKNIGVLSARYEAVQKDITNAISLTKLDKAI